MGKPYCCKETEIDIFNDGMATGIKEEKFNNEKLEQLFSYRAAKSSSNLPVKIIQSAC